MEKVLQRLARLTHLARPLALTFVGIVLLSLGVAYFTIAVYREVGLPEIFYYFTLQFLPRYARGILLTVAGLVVLGAGLWQLSAVVLVPLKDAPEKPGELVLGYRQGGPPRIAMLSGGPGMLVLASLGHHVQRLTCITPVHDPVEYYYRAASLYNFENVLYVAPTATTLQVLARLDDGSTYNIRHRIAHDDTLARRRVAQLILAGPHGELPPPNVEPFRQAIDAINQADTILLGPGSLYESIVPNLLIPGIADAIRQSRARKIYVCNLMTEPGLTTNYSVADHIRTITRYGGFTPDYVLVNMQRIDPEVQRVYQLANQQPVYLSPEEYEETTVATTGQLATRDLVVEGAVVIETDLASSVVQLTASLDNPAEQRAIRVLRHDPDKLTAAILGIAQRA